MPALASDNFDRAAGSLGANWTTIKLETMLVIDPGVCGHTSTNGDQDGGAIYSAIAWPNDQYSKAIINSPQHAVSLGDGIGVCCRAVSGGSETQYECVTGDTGANTNLGKRVGGVKTNFAQYAAQQFVATDEIYVEAQGSQIVGKRNGETILSQTDSTIGGGSAGVYNSGEISTSPNWGTLDNWEGGSFDVSPKRTQMFFFMPPVGKS